MTSRCCACCRVITEALYKELKEKRDAQAKHARRGGIVIEAAMRRLDKSPAMRKRAKADLARELALVRFCSLPFSRSPGENAGKKRSTGLCRPLCTCAVT